MRKQAVWMLYVVLTLALFAATAIGSGDNDGDHECGISCITGSCSASGPPPCTCYCRGFLGLGGPVCSCGGVELESA